jgi:hypothetical protein
MFGVLGYASLTFGTLFYNLYLKEMEVRTNLFYGCVIGVIGQVVIFAWVMRWNLIVGVGDIFCVVFTDVVFGTFGLAFW